MKELVLDASVVLKWFRAEGERHSEAAKELRERFEGGELRVAAPPLLLLEILNVAARRWGWSKKELDVLATSLLDLGFEQIEPELDRVAEWAGQGLTAYDAAYVAVAEEAGLTLVTDDAAICSIAGSIAEPLHSD